MPEEYQLKITKLREKYLFSQESQSDIDDLEKGLGLIFEQKKMAENPIFKAIMKDAEKRLNDLNALIANDETLAESERRMLFEQRRVWRFVFERFGLVPQDTALKLMTSNIESKLAQ